MNKKEEVIKKRNNQRILKSQKQANKNIYQEEGNLPESGIKRQRNRNTREEISRDEISEIQYLAKRRARKRKQKIKDGLIKEIIQENFPLEKNTNFQIERTYEAQSTICENRYTLRHIIVKFKNIWGQRKDPESCQRRGKYRSNKESGVFPGSPVVKNWCFQCRGCGFNP